MKNLKEYLNNKEKIWVSINESDFPLFLQYAKNNNCTWGDGRKINIKKDKCGYYMSINTQMQLSFVPAYCWYIKASNSPKTYKFRELLGE